MIKIQWENDNPAIDTLYYSHPDSTKFKLQGILQGDTLEIWTTRKEKSDFLLMNRGFRWVNERPFNR